MLLPLILAGILYGFDRWQEKRGKRPEGRLPASFKWLYLLSFIGCLTHPALDWLNVYGIRLLEPFSSQWFYGDTLFIIDVWLWALMGFAMWFSLRREKRGGEWTKPARVAIAVALAYVGVNAWQTDRLYESLSVQLPDPQAIVSPVPFAFWDREVIVGSRQTHRFEWGTAYGGLDEDLSKAAFCIFSDADLSLLGDPEVDAFLFWSRAPFAERAEDGSVILRDARFYDPLARDRFSVALPGVKCVEPRVE